MTESLRIIVADDEPDVLQHFRECLEDLGHTVVATVSTGVALVEQTLALRPDLIVTDVKMPGMDGIDAAVQISQDSLPIPVILVSAYYDEELIERATSDHVLAYLVKPVRRADFAPAIALTMQRFREFRLLQLQASDLRQTIEDRKLVERAKGVLMKQRGFSEEDAFHRIQKLSRDNNRRMAEIAGDILLAMEAMGE